MRRLYRFDMMSRSERRTLVALRPNIMIEGQESDVERTLVAVTADFRPGTCEWSALASHHAETPVATIIVRDVTRLPLADLQRLSEWLDATNPRVQLIVTSSTPVFRAVQQGRFPADLYYRLNTVMLADAQYGAA
jgi:hypothetical protein